MDRTGKRVALALLALLTVVACGQSAAGPRPDIILITVDTLRRDHLSSYGHGRPTTPFIDSLAASGVRFTNAYSTSCWTVPAIASLMTSLHPVSHGIVTGAVSRGEIRGQQVLPANLDRLPELLRGGGYRTFGITSNGHLSRELGYAQGFDRYENLGFAASAKEVNGKLAEWKEELAGDSPYFLWLHYIDPHAPYSPHKTWLETYASDMPVKEPGRLSVNHAAKYLRMGIKNDSPEFDYIVALYDGEVAFVDHAIGEAVRLLDPDSRGLILVTSDHGEEFLDHRRFGHPDSLHEELIAIPLIARFPDRRYSGNVIDSALSILDVGPALLDYVGVDVPDRLQGTSFMDLVEGRNRDASRPVVSSVARRENLRIDSVVRDGWKYIRYRGVPSREELFCLATDPGERRNVAMKRPLLRADLGALLSAELARLAAPAEVESVTITDEELEQLRSLGYVD